MKDYSTMDDNLSKSQLDIGESSNLAQIAQTYDYTYGEQLYADYVCILSVIAQAAIDSAKRRFDIDIAKEIRRIKKDMKINKNGLPIFWKLIKSDVKDRKISKELHCPMNYLYDLELNKFRNDTSTLPMSYFFNKFELSKNRVTCKKVEDLISKYSFNLERNRNWDERETYLLLRDDFEDMVSEIQSMYLSKNYLGLMSWLIDRAFAISSEIRSNKDKIDTKLNMNKAILIKTLYNVNSAGLLKCLSKNC